MKKVFGLLFIFPIILFISCKENVTETTPPTLSDVKILHPNGGEKFIGLEQDTIRWSNPETIESMGLYYTIDNGKKWTALANSVNIPSGKFAWTIPDKISNTVKIKIMAYSGGSENVVESDSVFQICRRIDILTPNNLTGLDIDTIRYITNYRYNSIEFYYATNIIVNEYGTYYDDWEGNRINWIKIESNTTFPDSSLVWRASNKSGPYKIKAIGTFDDMTMTFYSNEFLIEEVNCKIIYPNGFEVFSFPQNIVIKWESLKHIPEKIEIYYSKFNIGKTSNWKLIDDNIDPSASSYNWEIPSMYSNEVKLKIVFVFPDSIIAYGINNTIFTIHDNKVLEEQRLYNKKFDLGNKWVYLETKDYVWDPDQEYYTMEEVIGNKIENGIKYYNVLRHVIKDSITTTNNWVEGRENYSPTFVMQNGDGYGIDYYNYGINCQEYEEEVFTNQYKIKKYRWGDAYSNGYSKNAKDFGRYMYYSMVEGNLDKSVLLGAYIDGVLYGDTTTAY